MATLHRLPSLRSLARTPHRGMVEVATIFGLYAFYEAVRGQGSASLTVARGHTDEIVALERHLHIFGERSVQHGPAVPQSMSSSGHGQMIEAARDATTPPSALGTNRFLAESRE